MKAIVRRTVGTTAAIALAGTLTACTTSMLSSKTPSSSPSFQTEASDLSMSSSQASAPTASSSATSSESASSSSASVESSDADTTRSESSEAADRSQDSSSPASADEARAALNISEDYRDSFVHGDKPAMYQRYIVLHDTEGEGDASGVIDYWDGNDRGVAAHFVINKDGSIVQCVSLEKITHHAGFGNTGHNEEFGVEDESRDDKVGTTPIGDWAADYGMNSYSVGIEMVHASGGSPYTEEQLNALDALIAYIDAYYGFESTIIDHKAWRTGNSDTSPEFSDYLDNYQDHRTHS